ncbi:MAG TPA: hypothetical protein VE974_28395 [Thermoanaerobaculia bacterium]|nr:hypothetical protein [Thermoanaerobaculia bacterium]
MPDYLTRVAMAGARTGLARGRPVSVPAALPPTIPHAAHAAGLTVSAPAPPAPGSESFEMTVDLPPAAPMPARPMPQARAEAEPDEPVARAGVAPEVSAEAPAPESTATERSDTEAPVRPPAGTRLVGPNTETHVVEMPRALRPVFPRIELTLPRPKPQTSEEAPQTIEPAASASPGAETPDRAAIAEVPRVEPAERPAPRAASIGSENASRPARVEATATVVEPAPATRAPAIPVPEVRPPLIPRVQAADATRAMPVPEAAVRGPSPQRNRITIGRLELQVRNTPPVPQPPVIVRARQVPRAPSSALEGRFLERLPWKL